ncbi:hypothetical protein [Pedobacter jamesrossensis]|uniref:Uncharacterized protein n=2 Tax=Pedobacter jamesrossensis TaxID=1908238 RepID=A0ABV8NPI5_9SPHI
MFDFHTSCFSQVANLEQNVKAALINTFLDEANESSVFNGNILIEDGGK